MTGQPMQIRSISDVAIEAEGLKTESARAMLWERYARTLATALAESLCGAYYWRSGSPWLRCHRKAGHDPELMHQTADHTGAVYVWAVGS